MQTSWLLFLRCLDALEQGRSDETALEGNKYIFILNKPYRWDEWAAPKGNDGNIAHNKAMVGAGLPDFVNGKLFPYLHGFASFPISLPSLAEQRRTADRFERLRRETQRLDSIYQQKLAALEELKKSLLHEAFCGAL